MTAELQPPSWVEKAILYVELDVMSRQIPLGAFLGGVGVALICFGKPSTGRTYEQLFWPGGVSTLLAGCVLGSIWALYWQSVMTNFPLYPAVCGALLPERIANAYQGMSIFWGLLFARSSNLAKRTSFSASICAKAKRRYFRDGFLEMGLHVSLILFVGFLGQATKSPGLIVYLIAAVGVYRYSVAIVWRGLDGRLRTILGHSPYEVMESLGWEWTWYKGWKRVYG